MWLADGLVPPYLLNHGQDVYTRISASGGTIPGSPTTGLRISGLVAAKPCPAVEREGRLPILLTILSARNELADAVRPGHDLSTNWRQQVRLGQAWKA
jgi:hypothetical protein